MNNIPRNYKIKIVEDLDTKTEYVYLKVKINKDAPKEESKKEENALPF